MKAVHAPYLVCSADQVRKDAVMIWEDGVIREILPWDAFAEWKRAHPEETELKEAADSVVFPGFVNAHMHLYGVLSHGIPPAGHVTDFRSFLTDYWWPSVENRIRREETVVTARAMMAEMLRSGITSFCDILEAPFTEDDTLPALGQEIREAGMRGIVGLESSERVSPENGARCLQMNAEAADFFRHDPLVRGSICTHTTFTCSPSFIRRAKELAREKGVLLQFHLSESAYEPSLLKERAGKKPAVLYRELDALDSDTLATQCVKVDEEELEILRASGTGIVHMPVSNCEVGGGFSPVPDMLKGGMKPALGTDGYVNNFFEVMRAAFLVHKAARETTDVMDARSVFRMATEYGALALGRADTGTLEPGKKADFVIYRDNGPTPVTEGNIFDQIAVFGAPDRVSDVYVDGKAVLSGGQLVTMDEERVKAEVRSCAARFWKDL